MNNIPPKLRRDLFTDPAYKVCMLRAHKEHVCGGRLTKEHAVIVAGKQLQKKWAIISACARGQEVDEYQDAGTMDKDLNRWVALNRAEESELVEISRAIDYKRELVRLNAIYGAYVPIRSRPVSETEIQYPDFSKEIELSAW